MNLIQKCVSDLSFRIPIPVLQLAFKDDIQQWRRAPISLTEQIMLKVVRPRVLIDIDIVGGQTVIIPLENVTPQFLDTYTIVFEIPEFILNYRTIMSALSIGYMPYASSFNSLGVGMGVVNPGSMSDLLSAAQRVGDSLSNVPNISNATVELIGHNTILIRDQLRVTNAYQLRCVLGNEENLNNIQPRSSLVFAKVIELAVKSYIYNTLIVKIDQAYLQGGQELGRIKEIVDSYSDSEQMYQDYLKEVVQAVSFMNNNNMSHERFIKLQISPGI